MANFGFGIVGFVAALIGLVPAILIALAVADGWSGRRRGDGWAGDCDGFDAEAIFKAALYGYVADGSVGEALTGTRWTGPTGPGAAGTGGSRYG